MWEIAFVSACTRNEKCKFNELDHAFAAFDVLAILFPAESNFSVELRENSMSAVATAPLHFHSICQCTRRSHHAHKPLSPFTVLSIIWIIAAIIAIIAQIKLARKMATGFSFDLQMHFERSLIQRADDLCCAVHSINMEMETNVSIVVSRLLSFYAIVLWNVK